VGTSSPANRRSSVVLPAPLSPTTPRASPSSRERSMESRALLELKLLDAPSSLKSSSYRSLPSQAIRKLRARTTMRSM
jgi:hypothetical protein